MDKNNKDFSPEESLLVIRSMIETTRHSFSDRSHYFLLWGWATLIGSVLQYYLMVIVQYEHHYNAWLITLVALTIHLYLMQRDHKRESVRTFINEVMGYTWTVVGFSYMVLPIVFAKIGWQYCFPFYILLYGIGTFITGKVISFRPLVYGGAGCLALAAITPYFPYEIQILFAAFGILISYIIPGHLLRYHYRKNSQS